MGYKTRKQEKFDSIYRLYGHDVYKISLYYTKNEDVAQEMAQKAFYNLYIHFDNVNEKAMRAYLFRSARNMSFNWIRDSKRLRFGHLKEVMDAAGIERSVEDTYFIAQDHRSARDLSESILTRLYEENELWYEAIVLVYYLEKSHAQVAEELGVSKDVIHSRLYRAKKWIRKNYQEEYNKFSKGS